MSVSRSLLMLFALGLVVVVASATLHKHHPGHKSGPHRCLIKYKICSQIYKPVCGTDHVTYSNICEFNKAKCHKSWLTIARHGACKRHHEHPHRPHHEHPHRPHRRPHHKRPHFEEEEEQFQEQEQEQDQKVNVNVDVDVDAEQNQEQNQRED